MSPFEPSMAARSYGGRWTVATHLCHGGRGAPQDLRVHAALCFPSAPSAPTRHLQRGVPGAFDRRSAPWPGDHRLHADSHGGTCAHRPPREHRAPAPAAADREPGATAERPATAIRRDPAGRPGREAADPGSAPRPSARRPRGPPRRHGVRRCHRWLGRSRMRSRPQPSDPCGDAAEPRRREQRRWTVDGSITTHGVRRLAVPLGRPYAKTIRAFEDAIPALDRSQFAGLPDWDAPRRCSADTAPAPATPGPVAPTTAS